MNEVYSYKGKNLTTLVLTKIEHVASIVASREMISFELAYRSFISSKTFDILQNMQTLLWSESAEFIVEEYYRETTA
ncbi:MAG: hypothetical protein FWD27_08960 [Coriobacteriia bacterium]|nr:hypothetical protein [Coriobacteriia bacterium]